MLSRNRHAFGTRLVSPSVPATTSSQNTSSPGSVTKARGTSTSEHGGHTPSNGHDDDRLPSPMPHPASSLSTRSNEQGYIEEPVVARVSFHATREERAFQIAKAVTGSADPNGNHIVKPLDLIRLKPSAGDRGLIVVAIYQDPGHNSLFDYLDMGPAFYRARKDGDIYQAFRPSHWNMRPPIDLQRFLDFAIGASQCLEILHYGRGMIHGEIRGDAFHFSAQDKKVRIMSFGSGTRSFEHGLTSTGWSALSRELGVKNKLLYISPEQTGRMPAEPDSRTDIYSLGVLLWMLLTQQPAFSGDNAFDIVQGVLGRRIPNVTSLRIDVPDAIGRIIQKCTAKNVTDRYHSASGLRHDLLAVQKFLGDGDLAGLKDWSIGSKDVSSFFMLPTSMIGREKEKKALIRVIERVGRSHALNRIQNTQTFSDSTSSHAEMVIFEDGSSEGGASSVDATTRRSGSFTQSMVTEQKPFAASSFHSTISDNQTGSETVSSTHSTGTVPIPRITRRWERHQSISAENSSTIDSFGAESNGNRNSSTIDSGASMLSRQLGTVKYRRRGHCEIVTLEGAGGLGKSILVQSVLPDIRKRGYCATAKFDTARRVAFGPIIKLLSSLFKQVWGERDTETPFHQGLKQYVRPVWPMLHKVLGLPEFLLGFPAETGISRSISLSQNSPASSIGRAAGKRRGSSPGISPAPSSKNSVKTKSSKHTHDFLRAGASTKTMRFVNTLLDVLRMFTHHKFICLCLEDMHFADDESLDLISQIIAARLKMVMILTYRPDELSPEKMQRIICPPDMDELPGNVRPVITRISIAPLCEQDVVEYVSVTLRRSRDEVLSLALVIQSKSAGNPFYMREILSACYRKRSIYYNYRDSQWHYDLDKLFEQFRGDDDSDVLGTDFVTRRLGELPDSARAFLAWAALLGNTFSLELITRLMGGEFDYVDENSNCCPEPAQRKWTEGDVIAGLQAALQAYIIVQSENDDRFRFAHDRYIHASADLKECNAEKMHFTIAQTLLKYYSVEARQMDTTASHITRSKTLIKNRLPRRRGFRKLLGECAQAATENGARPTAAAYHTAALTLLQDDPWSEDDEDVSYDETLQLYFRAAECNLFMGQLSAANDLLTTIFSNAKTAVDKAPAYILQSRIFAQNGNSLAALISLKECLISLGVKLDENVTYDECDKKFYDLSEKIQSTERSALVSGPKCTDSDVACISAVISEAMSAAWWTDCLQYYQLTLLILDLHFTHGSFPQSVMAFLNIGIIGLCRFSMAHFAVEMGTISQDLLYEGRDAFCMARGQMLHASSIGHIHCSLGLTIAQMEDAIELASVGGDRLETILSYGLAAQAKFLASENLADLESYCQYACEEIPNWHSDSRGGAMLVAVRQACRALQGKTRTDDPLGVMTDHQHNGAQYKTWLMTGILDSNTSALFYESLELVILFLFGHYDRAVEIGRSCYEQLADLWASRNSRLVLLFYGLSRAGQLLRLMQDPRSQSQDFTEETQDVLAQLKLFVNMTLEWAQVSDVNYLCWARLLEAQMAELSLSHGEAVQGYEEALDHATEHHFFFEEALGNYLMAGFFLRRKARRSERSELIEAVGLFRQLAATGIASSIEAEHSLLLHGPTRSHQTAEVGIQTDFVADTPATHYRQGDGEDGEELTQVTSNTTTELRGERIGAWRGSMPTQNWPSLPTLDMIDLHAILESSQVISSVLQVDKLLQTMCDVILKTCGGNATLAAMIIQDPDAEDGAKEEWCIAASGDPDNGASAHQPGLPLEGTSLVADNVVLYCTRFIESVLIPDVLTDERSSNVSDAWFRRNPLGKSIIAIPITHGSKALFGVLYMEGEPRSFTDRNVMVLQLLVNQIAISYSNALSMKRIEKVSAENRSMVSVQKQSLANAIESEAKAKSAEAEAKRNVKLAEEAAKAKAIFLANVSHELRTPLNGVIGNSELLRDSALNKEQTEMADSIRVSADLLLTVINDILDFSKMEADKMKLHMIAFNPEELVREVVRAVSYSNREKTSKKNVKIIHDIKLPSVLMFGDPIRLHQVLGNLIGNSLKFTDTGSITIGARVDAETEKKATLTFWVKDTGIGIPPQQLAKLFQPFSQADASTARKYGGSGLGLSICKSLIETMMKGKIQLESEENSGTTAWFTVSFEKADADVSAGDAQAKSPTVDRYSAVTSPLERRHPTHSFVDLSQIPRDHIRICIAEDNPINQKIAIQYVQRLGYPNVDAYENGQKAVEGLREKAKEGNPYHVVLMDVMMPVLDGYEATKLIRKDPVEAVRKTLVIAMTASAIQGDREKCLAAGMNDYLAKPVRSEVLRKKLDAYISPDVSGEEHSGKRSSLEVTSPVSNPTNHESRFPTTQSVMDPMEEGAVFNQPLNSEGYHASDSPTFSVDESQGPPPSLSLRPKLSQGGSSSSTQTVVPADNSKPGLESANSQGSDLPSQKRQPRKLTKSRGNSDANGERGSSDDTVVNDVADKTKSLLTKKSHRRKASAANSSHNQADGAASKENGTS